MLDVFLSEFFLYIPKGTVGETWVEKVSTPHCEQYRMNVPIHK